MFSCDDIDHIAEEVADTLIEKGYRATFTSNLASETQKAFKEGYEKGCEDGREQVEKGSYERGRADEANAAKNGIYALREELRRVSEDSRERDNENLRLKSVVDELSEKNEYLEKALRNSVEVINAGEKELVEVGRKAVKEFAGKLREQCKKNFDTMDEQAVWLVDIDRLLQGYGNFPECLDCEAFSGTDCTRNPYTEGCLKEENKK